MNKPLFEIGEKVILVSKDRPDLNGEDVVVEIVYKNTKSHCRLSGLDALYSYIIDEFGYKLERAVVETTTMEGNSCESIWRQSALRKKHQPSEMNFNELMSSLNIPITTW